MTIVARILLDMVYTALQHQTAYKTGQKLSILFILMQMTLQI